MEQEVTHSQTGDRFDVDLNFTDTESGVHDLCATSPMPHVLQTDHESKDDTNLPDQLRFPRSTSSVSGDTVSSESHMSKSPQDSPSLSSPLRGKRSRDEGSSKKEAEEGDARDPQDKKPRATEPSDDDMEAHNKADKCTDCSNFGEDQMDLGDQEATSKNEVEQSELNEKEDVDADGDFEFENEAPFYSQDVVEKVETDRWLKKIAEEELKRIEENNGFDVSHLISPDPKIRACSETIFVKLEGTDVGYEPVKGILAESCEFFRCMATGGWGDCKPIKLDDGRVVNSIVIQQNEALDKETFELCILWIFGKRFDIAEDPLKCRLWAAADFLGIEELKRFIEKDGKDNTSAGGQSSGTNENQAIKGGQNSAETGVAVQEMHTCEEISSKDLQLLVDHGIVEQKTAEITPYCVPRISETAIEIIHGLPSFQEVSIELGRPENEVCGMVAQGLLWRVMVGGRLKFFKVKELYFRGHIPVEFAAQKLGFTVQDFCGLWGIQFMEFYGKNYISEEDFRKLTDVTFFF